MTIEELESQCVCDCVVIPTSISGLPETEPSRYELATKQSVQFCKPPPRQLTVVLTESCA
jgi:hypothetical protein